MIVIATSIWFNMSNGSTLSDLKAVEPASLRQYEYIVNQSPEGSAAWTTQRLLPHWHEQSECDQRPTKRHGNLLNADKLMHKFKWLSSKWVND